MIDWIRFKEVIAANNSFCLVSHIRPDCDALGSEIGMACVLESLGKKVQIINGDPLRTTLRLSIQHNAFK